MSGFFEVAPRPGQKEREESGLPKATPVSLLDRFYSALAEAADTDRFTADWNLQEQRKTRRPYLHFADFLAEQGKRPLIDLTEYDEFLSQLIESGNLELVVKRSLHWDHEHEVWKWFWESFTKNSHGNLEVLLRFPKVLHSVFYNTVSIVHSESWSPAAELCAYLLDQLQSAKVDDLLPFQPILLDIVYRLNLRQNNSFPKLSTDEYLSVKEEAERASSLEQAQYSTIELQLTSLIDAGNLSQLTGLCPLLERMMLLCEPFRATDTTTHVTIPTRLEQTLYAKLSVLPFSELHLWAGVMSRLSYVVRYARPGVVPAFGSGTWIAQRMSAVQMNDLEPWRGYLSELSFQSKSRIEVFQKKALELIAADNQEELLSWIDPMSRLLNSNGKDLVSAAIRTKLEQLVTEPESEQTWLKIETYLKVLSKLSTEKFDLASWFREKIISVIPTKGVKIIAAAEGYYSLAMKNFSNNQFVLFCEQLQPYLTSAEGWIELNKVMVTLLGNLQHSYYRNKWGLSSENATTRVKELWESFCMAFNMRSDLLPKAGSLLSYFMFFGDQRDTVLLDSELVFSWVRQQLTPQVTLDQMVSSVCVLLHPGMIDQLYSLMSRVTLEQVITCQPFTQGTRPMGGDMVFSEQNLRAELLVRFAKETQDLAPGKLALFEGVFESFREFVMNLSIRELELMIAITRATPLLSHQMLAFVDGGLSAVEVPKTGGRLVIWRDELGGVFLSALLSPAGNEAWSKAHDLGIIVAPRFDVRDLSLYQEPSLQKMTGCTTWKVVDTRYCGQPVDVLTSHKLYPLLQTEIARQIENIKTVRRKQQINFTNAEMPHHDGEQNYLVELIERNYFEKHGGWEKINTMLYEQSAFTDDISVLDKYLGQEVYNEKTAPYILVVRNIDWDHAFVEGTEMEQIGIILNSDPGGMAVMG